jgi:hypothetical protein
MYLYHDMQQMGSQARGAGMSGRMHYVYGSHGLAGLIWIIYQDMEHTGSQARCAYAACMWIIWARRPEMPHVLE